jgi:hypothetical protein
MLVGNHRAQARGVEPASSAPAYLRGMSRSTPNGRPPVRSRIHLRSTSSCSGVCATAPSTPRPPALLTAATTSRQWVKARMGKIDPQHLGDSRAHRWPPFGRRAGSSGSDRFAIPDGNAACTTFGRLSRLPPDGQAIRDVRSGVAAQLPLRSPSSASLASPSGPLRESLRARAGHYPATCLGGS